MRDREDLPFEDNPDIEITDLDVQGKEAGTGAAPGGRRAIAVAHSLAHLLLKPSRSHREQILRASVTVSLVALALLVMLGGIVPARQYVLGLLARSTSSDTTGATSFYIYASPAWGRLFVDGAPLAHLPLNGRDVPLALSNGHHQLIWRAEPFQPLRCIISVPITSSDTCHYIAAKQDAFEPAQAKAAQHAWQLFFNDSLTMLSAAQQSALLKASQTALNTLQSSETVYPGEAYVHSQTTYTLDTARQPLHATLHYQLGLPGELNSPCIHEPLPCSILLQDQFQDCQFCAPPGQAGYTDTSWYAIVIVYPVWDYTTLDGHSVARNQPDDDTVDANAFTLAQSVSLEISWTKGLWHVFIPAFDMGASNLACTSPNYIIDNVMSASTQASSGSFVWRFGSGRVSADGCLALAQVMPANSATSFASTQMAYCLYRFGVVLAANDLAHHFWPHLPVADAYEQSLARQLAKGLTN